MRRAWSRRRQSRSPAIARPKRGGVMKDLVLPAFAMDCRDWLVVTPAQVGLPDEVGGAPLLAVLSTAVLGQNSFRSASAVLTVGLLDSDVPARPVAGGTVAVELVDGDGATCNGPG